MSREEGLFRRQGFICIRAGCGTYVGDLGPCSTRDCDLATRSHALASKLQEKCVADTTLQQLGEQNKCTKQIQISMGCGLNQHDESKIQDAM
jgi:hypothetical protein